MALEEARQIEITFKYIYPYDIPDKVKFFKSTDMLQDAASFLGINDFNDYKIFCRGIRMVPIDIFGLFAFGEDKLTIIIEKRHLIRTKLIRKF